MVSLNYNQEKQPPDSLILGLPKFFGVKSADPHVKIWVKITVEVSFDETVMSN